MEKETNKRLIECEKLLEIGSTDMAKRLRTGYDSYKNWRSGRYKTPAAVELAAELLTAIELSNSMQKINKQMKKTFDS